jgi:osmotically inducible protein OsmC
MKRNATAVWQGSGKIGEGNLTTQSGVLDKTPYSFKSRFEEGEIGTNPEELIAAAHAGCFTMKLSIDIADAGYEVKELETNCIITFESGTVTQSHLIVKAVIKDIKEEAFSVLLNSAKETCPISRLLNTNITAEWTINGRKGMA